MSTFIDRRKNTSHKSIGNRQKFLKRIQGQIKKALPDVISGQNIKDISTNGKVKVPIKGIKEPEFRFNPKTGKKEYIKPGNDQFNSGDRIPKPFDEEGEGGNEGSNNPDITQDEFVVQLDKDEFLEYFFEDLELPNLIKKDLESIINYKRVRAGFVPVGPPERLNIKKSFKQSLARQISVTSNLEKKIEELKEKLTNEKDELIKSTLLLEIEKFEKKLAAIPFLDKIDLRFNNFQNIPEPTTKAVMFCVMDVSGSMGEHEKDIAKRFFMLLYLFLTKSYKEIDIIFIRHHTEAKEVDEQEFFYSQESGGTIVYPSLELVNKIINDRYSDNTWNIFCAQASDGDTWDNSDGQRCAQILKNTLLNKFQYMAYIEINERPDNSILWNCYKQIINDGFAIKKLYQHSEIWTVFSDLFKKNKINEKVN